MKKNNRFMDLDLRIISKNNPKVRPPSFKKAPVKSDLEPAKKKVEQLIKPQSRKKDSVKATKVKVNFSSKVKKIIPISLTMLLLMSAVHLGSYMNSAQEASRQILGAATSAYANLDSASKNLEDKNFDGAQNLFDSAQLNLTQAQNQLNNFKALVLLAPPAKSADNILEGAYLLAESGKKLTEALKLFDELVVNSSGVATENFSVKLKSNQILLTQSLDLLKKANQKFENTSGLPTEYKDSLLQAKGQVAGLTGILENLVNLEDLYMSFFGDQNKTYLLVFQNYDEMRATGGFIGTYGVLNIDKGEIKKLQIASIYNLDGSLTSNIAAPGPFQPYIQKWALRDSNWFADFRLSSQKMLKFFEKESQTANGVIAITPQLFEQLLSLVGPIQMSQYDVTLTPENFQGVVQAQTSIEYNKKLNQPKKFLDDFAPILLNRLSDFNKEQWFQFFQVLQNNFKQKQVLIYSTDPNTQNKIEQLGYDGGLVKTDFDYLSVVNSNLGGNKTDLDINQALEYTSKFNPDGSILNTVKVIRQNNSEFVNKNFMRVLVPFGSRLLSAKGFANYPQFPSFVNDFSYDLDLQLWDEGTLSNYNVFVRTESGKTEFTGWTETLGSSTSEVELIYLLPLRLDFSWFNKTQEYSLVFQKQPGNKTTKFVGKWQLGDLERVWSTPNSILEKSELKFNTNGITDSYFGAVLKK